MPSPPFQLQWLLSRNCLESERQRKTNEYFTNTSPTLMSTESYKESSLVRQVLSIWSTTLWMPTAHQAMGRTLSFPGEPCLSHLGVIVSEEDAYGTVTQCCISSLSHPLDLSHGSKKRETTQTKCPEHLKIMAKCLGMLKSHPTGTVSYDSENTVKTCTFCLRRTKLTFSLAVRPMVHRRALPGSCFSYSWVPWLMFGWILAFISWKCGQKVLTSVFGIEDSFPFPQGVLFLRNSRNAV